MKNQVTFVRNHLIDHGYITDAIAQQYRIRRLGARIFDLLGEADPMDIQKQTLRDDLGQRYTRYFLSPLEQVVQRGIRMHRSAMAERIRMDEAA